MKLKTLTTAMILATVPMTGAFAAALDRSGQSISAFLQPGNYFEAGISVLDPDVSGKAISTAGAAIFLTWEMITTSPQLLLNYK